MAWFLGQSLVIIALAFLLGLLVGWLWWGRRGRQEEVSGAEPVGVVEPAPAPVVVAEPVVVPEPAVEAEEEPVVEPVVPAAVESAPVEIQRIASVPAQAPASAPDDELERIEGIGPKMAGALKKAGIRTYAELAESTEDSLRAAIEANGLRFAPSLVTWARQARLLADGDEDGFAELTRRLVAGRDEGRA